MSPATQQAVHFEKLTCSLQELELLSWIFSLVKQHWHQISPGAAIACCRHADLSFESLAPESQAATHMVLSPPLSSVLTSNTASPVTLQLHGKGRSKSTPWGAHLCEQCKSQLEERDGDMEGFPADFTQLSFQTKMKMLVRKLPNCYSFCCFCTHIGAGTSNEAVAPSPTTGRATSQGHSRVWPGTNIAALTSDPETMWSQSCSKLTEEKKHPGLKKCLDQ